MSGWFTTTASTILAAVLTTVGIYAAVIIATRVAGLRSFSKMSSFDFAVTVAIGTLIASTALSRDPPLLRAISVLVAIYVLKYLIARLRLRSDRISALLDNRPVLLMEDGRVLHENLRALHMTEGELQSKLRQANVLAYADVRAVVMETTGDISVITGNRPIEPPLLERVKR